MVSEIHYRLCNYCRITVRATERSMFVWTDGAEWGGSYQELREALITASIFALVHGCQNCTGGEVSTRSKDYSLCFKDTECHREKLTQNGGVIVVVWRLEMFRSYYSDIHSSPIKVITDHRVLEHLTAGKNLPGGSCGHFV